MPAAVVKGIIFSISIIAALGLAVLENPQVQIWLEEQRRKIQELLRSLGEELDPDSRRTAEAFAFEGRTPANDEGLRREMSGSREAAAIATGRSLSNAGTVRRIPVRGPSDPDEAEERRRKGREYLAKRNQQMYELQQKRKAAKADGAATPPTPTSFDALVDADGKLKGIQKENEACSAPPVVQPVPEHITQEMREVERHLVKPMLEGEPSSSGLSGFELGSQLANPFGDEYEMDLSETPKLTLPPNSCLRDEGVREDPLIPESYVPLPGEEPSVLSEQEHEELSYEEQLAIALSLSEAESSTTGATVRQSQQDEDDSDLRAAIKASLEGLDEQQAAHAVANAGSLTPRPIRHRESCSQVGWQPPEHDWPLVDLTPPSPTIEPTRPPGRRDWEALFDPQYSPSHEPLSLAQPPASDVGTDELYRVTPELTRARLATLNAQQGMAPSASGSSIPYDPVREAAGELQQPLMMEASFYSAPSSVSPARSMTLARETPQLVTVPIAPSNERPESTSDSGPSSAGFQTDSESETFASMVPSREQSRPRSEFSGVEVIDVVDDSDVDMLSEEGDDIVTPDSWTEVGSRDGEDSEAESSGHGQSRAHTAL